MDLWLNGWHLLIKADVLPAVPVRQPARKGLSPYIKVVMPWWIKIAVLGAGNAKRSARLGALR